MRQLIREELAVPLNIDGILLGRPPATAPTRVAQIIHPQANFPNPIFNFLAPRAPLKPVTAGFIHNRLLTPMVETDQAGFVATAALIRRGAGLARAHGYREGNPFGGPSRSVPVLLVHGCES